MFGINLIGQSFKTAQYSSLVQYGPVQYISLGRAAQTVLQGKAM